MANIERLHLSASSFQVHIINKRKEGMKFRQKVWLAGARIYYMYIVEPVAGIVMRGREIGR